MINLPPTPTSSRSSLRQSSIFILPFLLLLLLPHSTYAQDNDEGKTILHWVHFENGIGSWYADNGIWQAGEATIGPDSAYEGSRVAATILNGNYPANTASRLVSPTYILPSSESLAGDRIRLSLQHWYSLSSSDSAKIQISVNRGPWMQLPGTTTISGLSNGWQQLIVGRMTAYADSSIRLGFLFESSDSFTGAGWYLDDLKIYSESAEGIRKEDFEGAVLDWVAVEGDWQFGEPLSGPMGAKQGDQVAATTLSGNYPDRDTLRLESPMIPLPPISLDRVHGINFWHWFDLAAGDSAGLQISYDGSTWQDLPARFFGQSGVWSQYTIPVLDPDSTDLNEIKIAFIVKTEQNGTNGAGWYLDAFEAVVLDSPYSIFDPVSIQDLTIIGPEPIHEGLEWFSDNGVWEVGVPDNAPFPADTFTTLAATILDGNYPNGVESRLVSPEFFTGEKEMQLVIEHWFEFSPGDQGIIQVSLDYGEWTDIPQPFTGTGGAFTQFNLDAIPGIADRNFRLGFLLTSQNEGATSAGWYIRSIQIGVQGTSNETLHQGANSASLDQNYPNPFSRITSIEFELHEAGNVQLEIFDLLGRRIETLVEEFLPGGQHSTTWDASDLASGLYIYRLQTESTVLKRQMIVNK